MAMTVLITLTTAGSDTGPFDLYSNVDGYVAAFESGVAKAALVAGYISVLVPDGTTTVRVKSTVTCTNYVDLVVTTTTTTTSSTTTTTTTTTAPENVLYISARDVGGDLNVTLYASVNGGFPIDLGIIDGLICFDAGSIGSLLLGSIVTFTTSTSCIMRGAVGYNVCPTMSGSATSYTYTVGSIGANYVSLSINSTIIP